MKKILTVLSLLAFNVLFAQQKIVRYTHVDPTQWVIPKTDTLDYAFETYNGAEALTLKRNIANYKSASIAYPRDLNFKDGSIELDISTTAGKNAFVGFAFRIKDEHHYEVVYFRPGSSGSINAVQYMPEKKTEFNWWDYEKDIYQAKATVPLIGWFHVKAVVKGRQLAVYLNDFTKPIMVRDDLDASLDSGSVGFWLGNCASGAYKDLTIKIF
jgi:hypothetical protein